MESGIVRASRMRCATALVALAAISACRDPATPNVVLVVIDTLRRDHLSGLGHERPTSPRLDELMEESVLFENLVSTSSQTVPAVASLLTGLYPSETSVQYYGKKSSFDGERPWSEVGPHFDASLTSLAERLRDAGYRTAAVVSNPWLKPEFGFDQGFETYVSLDCGDACDGKDVVRESLSWLERETSPSPFFLYLHFMDVHNPYRKKDITERVFVEKRGIDRYRNGPVPPELRPRDLEYMKALYDEGILRADGHLDRFLRELERHSAPERTLLVIVSDHGDEFAEHGGLGHGTTLYEELVGSFLLIRYPAKLPPARVSREASLVDVAPTILELLELDGLGAPYSGSGQSLLPWLEVGVPGADERVIFSELGSLKSARRGVFKLILDLDDGRRELYQLSSDSAETENVWTEHEEIAKDLARRLSRFVANARGPGGGGGRPIDEELRERLRALGYVE
jgi:arylsulfatase A-like enzyme